MNNKGFVARDFIIAMILFSGVIALMTLALASLASDYNNTDVVSEDFSEKFDRFDENTDRATQMFEAVSADEGLSLFGAFDVLFSSTFGIISLVFEALTSVGGQVLGFSEFFGVPAEIAGVFFTIILSILTVLIVFIVISSVTRRDL